jgi:hypothetical protein
MKEGKRNQVKNDKEMKGNLRKGACTKIILKTT